MCSGSSLMYPVSDVQSFELALISEGYNQFVAQYQNSVNVYDFREASMMTDGHDETDPSGSDFADVIFFSGHGSHTCSASAHYSQIWMGSMGDKMDPTCDPQLQQEMRLGDAGGDANVMILASCESAQRCVFIAGGYSAIHAGTTEFNVHNGFHGTSWDNLANDGWYGDYATSAEFEGIGDDWVDWLTDTPWGDDQCATSIVWGASSATVTDIFNHGGFKDFHVSALIGVGAFYYMSPCNPGNGEAL